MIDIKDSEGDNYPMNTKQLNHNRKLMNALVKKITNEKGITSADELKAKILNLLKESFSDITLIYDENRNNFVHLLAKEEKYENMKLIVEAYYLELEKEDFYKWFTMENNDELTPLDIASQKGNKDIINYLFDKISKTDEKILRLDEHRNSLFHNAALNNQFYPILFFYEKLQRYFPQVKIIDMPNKLLITPLHYACYHKSYKIIDLLLDLGANINARDIEGKNILTYAVCSNSIRIVKKLLLRGANKHIKDFNGKTAYDIAIESNRIEIASILQSHNCINKIICNTIEFGSIKGLRKDHQTTYLFLFYYIFIGYFYIDTFINNSKEEKYIFFNEICYTILMCFSSLSLFTVTISFMLLIYFSVFYKRTNNESVNEIGDNDISLIDLYDDNKVMLICVKCRRKITDETMHCIVCNVCVDQWDHHCFWLNVCIDLNNKRRFQIFFSMLFIGVFCNIIFGITKVILIYSNDITNNDDTYMPYILLVIWMLFTLILMYTFAFILLPIYCCVLCKKNELNVTQMDNDINVNNKTNKDKSSFSL